MIRATRFGVALAAGCLLAPVGPARGQGGRPVAVEPDELTKRPDLVNREVVVDDRGGFQYHNETRMFDEINLRRAPEVEFKLPQTLWTRQSPPSGGVKVRGVLHRQGDRWWVEVSSFEALPPDLERLNRAIAALARSDVAARESWARWGLRRGEAFARLARRREPTRPTGEEALLERAREVLAEVYRTEGDHPPPHATADYWLDLASRARADGVPEPEPSALAHRGFRRALADATATDALDALVRRIAVVFPHAPTVAADAPEFAHWERPYEKAPADAYRAAPPAARATFDHRLWVDAVRRWLVKRTEEDPKSALAVAEEAARLLPDRPEFAAGLLDRAVAAAATDVGKLRQVDVDALAALYRDKLHQPEKAKALYRAWLDDQRSHRLSPRDADGRIALAEQYEKLVEDRAAAVALLRDAWKIDPGSREVADAFRTRRYKLVNDEWVDATAATPPVAAAPAPGVGGGASDPGDRDRPPAAAPSDGGLRGLTADDVRNRLGGKPNRTSLAASQGRVTEQWVYVVQRQLVYVTFARKPADPHPRVISYYSLPRPVHGPDDPP